MSQASFGYTVELDVFEGPLDLLLHLVRKHELDILDIPISFVTTKYLLYLDLMTQLNLDVAGEYLLMAATLAHIKSRQLLPAPPPGMDVEGDELTEEEGDPREELIRRLLEFQKYKEAAASLGNRPVVGRNVWGRGVAQVDAVAENVNAGDLPPLKEISVISLIEAFDRVLSRAKIALSHEVTVDRFSVSERINQLADRLDQEGSFTFFSCFDFLNREVTIAEARHEAVVTFLAMLEMAKLGVIRVWQGSTAGEECEDDDLTNQIVIARAENPHADGAAAPEGEGGAGKRLISIEDDYR